MRRALVLLALVPSFASGTVSFVAAGTASNTSALSLTITPSVPSSAVTDDILIVVMKSSLSATITCTANCGSPAYAEVASQVNVGLAVWYRRVQSGESGAVPTPTFSQSGTAGKFTGRVYVFRGVDTSTAIDAVGASNIVAESSGLTYTGDTISTTVDCSMVLYAGGSVDDDTWSSAAGSVDTILGTLNAASSPDNSIFLAYMAATNGAAGSKPAPTATMTTNGPDAGHSLTFALRAAVSDCPMGAGGMMGFWP
jgi:hypothetical protein